MKMFRAMFLVAVVGALPLISFAITKKSVTITEPVAIGNTVLKPGHYQVAWSGNGPQIPVEFKQGSKTLATAQATLKAAHNPYDSALELAAKVGNQPRPLHEIMFQKESLVFASSSGNAGE